MQEPQGTCLTQQIPTPWEQRRWCQQKKRSQRRKCPWAELYTVRGGRGGRLLYPHAHLYTEGYSKLVTQETTDPLLLHLVDVDQCDEWLLMFLVSIDVNVFQL